MSKIVNVFVLVLTIVSIFLAYKLYNKRVELVNRGDKMAVELNKIAENLDQASGTNLKDTLTTDALGHKKYADLDKLIPQLTAQSEKIANQKNSLADTMSSLAATLELDGISDTDLKDVAKYQAVAQDLSDKVTAVQASNENILDKVIAMGNTVGMTIDKATLKDIGQAGNEMDKLSGKVVTIKEKSDQLISGISEIASTLEISEPSLAGDDYQSSLDSTKNAVIKFKGVFDTTKENLAQSQTEVSGLKVSLKDMTSERDDATAESQKRLVEINKLRKLISPTGLDIKALVQSDVQRLRHVMGKVASIDKKLGFVIVSVGKYTKAVQKIGKIKNILNADIPNNCKLTVARPTKSGIQFIAEVNVFKVFDECSAANICETPKAGNVRVGDIVFFGREEIANLTSVE